MLDENTLTQVAKQLTHWTATTKGTILTIDDKKSNRDILKGELEKARYTCIPAASGSHAEEMCTAGLDAIVADYVLEPGRGKGATTGVEVVERLGKRLGEQPQRIVLIYTSHPKHESQRFQAVAKQKQPKTRIDAWLCIDDYKKGGYQQLVNDIIKLLDEHVYERRIGECAANVSKQFEKLLQPMKAEIDLYRQAIGGVSKPKCLHSYRGEVDDYRSSEENEDKNGEGSVHFKADAYDFRWTFPGDKLRAAQAAFVGAKVQWDIYVAGSTTISTLLYVGPNMREIHRQPSLYKLSSKELKELNI